MLWKQIPCRKENYGSKRVMPVRYLVIHYTAGDGDTAEDNGRYFQNHAAGASAHWFVDETSCLLSVPEDHVAWHCGAAVYRHPACRNGNSIGIELCSRKRDDGSYYFRDETLENAASLVRKLMKTYGIAEDRVVRHYDVTGKNCPAPLVDAGQWRRFQDMIKRYQSPEELPLWAKETIGKLMDRKILQGDGEGLDLSHEMVRILVMLDRAGVFS